MSIKPSQQGDLDHLCGIYSLVNALAYIYDGRINRKGLKMRLLQQYQKKWELEGLLLDGMDSENMDYLIKEVIHQGYYHQHYPVSITTPFRHQPHYLTRTILQRIDSYLNEDLEQDYRVVLMATAEHWSVVKKIDKQCLYFFDSCGVKRAFRSSFSLIEGRTRHQLVPDAIYFVQRII